MLEVKGKYNIAKIFTDVVDNETISQIITLLNQEFTQDSKIRIMPDCHAGAGCVIGTTMKIHNKVVPNLVGVDIGCGMKLVELGKSNINFEELDCFIRNNIPSGMNVNDEVLDNSINLKELKCFEFLKNDLYLMKSLGSLGGGNHFIEVDKDDEGNYYLVIHSGSRNLGLQVAKYYQRKAIEYHKNLIFDKQKEKKTIIEQLKKEGKQQLIQKVLKEIDEKLVKTHIPEDLCYVEGPLFDDYIHDMDICQKFAVINREVIAKKICLFLKINYNSLNGFETIHNYINMEDMILRKGAISAYKDQLVLIPINMRDGCIIGKGKENADFNYSAPHGAGRLLSRSEAKEKINLEDFEKTMEGIYTTSVNQSTIDESPFAYKPIESILENIKDTIEIVKIVKPIYNFKSSE